MRHFVAFGKILLNAYCVILNKKPGGQLNAAVVYLGS